jgi:hypothetical protein
MPRLRTSAHRSATAVLLALLVWGCAADNRLTEAQREKEFRDSSRANAENFVAKLKADAEAKIADYDRRLESYKPLSRSYFVCNRSASKIVSTQPGDPVSLAVAARSICRSEEANLREAVRAAYADDPKFGMDSMERFRAKALENNTGDIVAARAATNSNPALSRPPDIVQPKNSL